MLKSKTPVPWRAAGNQRNGAPEIRSQNMREFTLFNEQQSCSSLRSWFKLIVCNDFLKLGMGGAKFVKHDWPCALNCPG